MSLLPLPSAVAAVLRGNAREEKPPGAWLRSFRGSASLLFDKGMDRYEEKEGRWKIPSGQKQDFLEDFVAAFNTRDKDEYRSFLARRSAVLAGLEAGSCEHTTRSRLVVGLGLPSPIETGFLFDRLTGCPYLPGSSVKGLLRVAARLVREGEIPGERELWASHHERIFGPGIGPETLAATGEAVFYDAFPTDWPALEVDVLTPHYGPYYGGKEGDDLPADWHNPTPVPFLAVKAGTTFRFQMRASTGDLAQLEALLGPALDWLGIGAKKSAGYGIFGEEPATAGIPAASEPTTSRSSKPAASPSVTARPASAETSWDNVELNLRGSQVIARKGKQTAECPRDQAGRDVLDALKRHKELRAEVAVLKIPGGHRLVRVKRWRA
jgi:CRISPR type III-B/RAMP module RAMP protein Cmr6